MTNSMNWLCALGLGGVLVAFSGCAASGTIGAQWGDSVITVSGEVGTMPKAGPGVEPGGKQVPLEDTFNRAEGLKERLEGDIAMLANRGPNVAAKLGQKQQVLLDVMAFKEALLR